MNRRRMMMEGGKKFFLFSEGSSGITGASGDIGGSQYYIGDCISLRGGTASTGDLLYGSFFFPVNLDGFSKICFEADLKFAGLEYIFGYAEKYSSAGFFEPELPDVYSGFSAEAERKVIKVKIEGKNAGIKNIVAAVKNIESLGSVRDVMKIYNIWLE